MTREAGVELDLLARIAQWARVQPDTVAVDAREVQVSYRALDRQAGAVSLALRDAGCVPGDRVAVWVKDRAALVSVMLGVLRSGAVFVPLEADAPEERLRQRLARLQPGLLLHDARAVHKNGLCKSVRTKFGKVARSWFIKNG